MNRFDNITKPLMWFMALLLAAVVTGCGGGGGSSAPSSAKAINTFSLAWTTGTPASATGIINQTLKTINVTIPYGTNLSPLFATFTTTGTKVTVGSPEVTQASGITQNDFSNPVGYKVYAADGTWSTYTVIVTVSANTAKAITTFTLAGPLGTPISIGTVISGTSSPYNIAVTMPFGTTDLTALVATFTTTGSSVKVGTIVQTTGTSQNDFSNSVTTPVAYTVTAANSTTAIYNVTVTVALSSAKAISAFSLAAASGVPASTATAITGSTSPFDIVVTMPNGTTNLTALVTTFTTDGSSVKVGTTVQTSGTSQNDFSAASGVSAIPVAFVVTAADASTATYNVTVQVATTTPLAPVNLLTAGNYVIFSDTAIANPGAAGSITGDIATGPGVTSTAISGFALVLDTLTGDFATSSLVTGKVYAHDYVGTASGLGTTPAAVNTASTDMLTAYNDAAGRPTPDFTELYTGDLSGKTLVPGLYKWGTSVLINTDVTLTGSATDVWIFQIAGDLTTAAGGSVPAGVHVILGGAAKASNIFWQVGGPVGATLGTYSTFEGNILSAKQIVMGTGAILSGRALAQTAVSMDANAVTPAP